MRSLGVIVLLGACALATGYYQTADTKFADAEFLKRQKLVFDVLQHVHQNEVFTTLFAEAAAFKLADYKEHYTNATRFDEFYERFAHGTFLAKNEIFSVLNFEQMVQARSLFYLFYYAKDWATFEKTFVWARFHFNEGQFVYAFSAAVLHRKDAAGIVLPAVYEIYPYYFFDTHVVQKAQLIKQQGFYGAKKIEDTFAYTIYDNHTYFHTTNDESKLAYFTDDIGLNAYHYYYHLDYPFWTDGQELGLYNDRRGEFYFYQYKQLLARYYLERLSNGLGDIAELSFRRPIDIGYQPALRYYNGEFFPARDNHYDVYAHDHNIYALQHIDDIERRLRDAIDYGYVHLPDGKHIDLRRPESVEQLGNLFQANGGSVYNRFYGYLETWAKKLLGASAGFGHHQHGYAVPSVLEHFETSLRDPVFYQLYKRILRYYFKFQSHLGAYKRPALAFDGVRITGAEFNDKLETYFDHFEADITNAVDVDGFDAAQATGKLFKFGRFAQYKGDDVYVKVCQHRLNHRPFTFQLHATSDKAQKAIVKVFIGPKFDEYGHPIEFAANAKHFYELDHFAVELTAGANVIARSSDDFTWFVKDRTTFYDLYKQLLLATGGEAKFPLDMSEAHCGVPNRLQLPKGTHDGQTFQFFFFVYPYRAPKTEQFAGYEKTLSCGVGSGARYLDDLPFGFPFDRPLDRTQWFTENMFYLDANVFHRKELKINAVPKAD